MELMATQFIWGDVREYEPVLVKSVLPVTNANTTLIFECVATNIAGEDHDIFTYKISCKDNANIPAAEHVFVHLTWSGHLMHL